MGGTKDRALGTAPAPAASGASVVAAREAGPKATGGPAASPGPVLGRVHSTDSFGSADGPGVRYLVFLQGCPMRCRYCHNPDTWGTDKGTWRSAAELLDEAERFRRYWGPEGGITVSGGEALMQAAFVAQLFEEAHARGINTCLDTSLAPFSREEPFLSTFRRVAGACDLVIADIKHIDPERHRWLTGRGNANILDGIRWLSDAGVPLWIRQVLVPGITDDEASLRRTRAFIETLSTVRRVEVLPYHTLGVYKWHELGIPYSLEDVEPPSAESVARATAILRGEA